MVLVLTCEVVRHAVHDLSNRRIHPNMVAYLHLRQRALAAGSFSDIEPDWTVVSALMRVPSGLITKPSFRPFSARAVNDPSRYWVNDHPAGSYGVSSLRGFSRELLLDQSGERYELAEDHASEALKILLGGTRVPAWSFASYFLRNYGFEITNPEADVPADSELLVSGFKREFRFDGADDDFTILFDDAPPDQNVIGDWFEPYAVGGMVHGD